MDKSPVSYKFYSLLLIFILNINYSFASLFNLPLPFNISKQDTASIDGKKYDNHWHYLKSNFIWHKEFTPYFEHKLVKQQLFRLSQHHSYMSDISKRAEPYLYYVSEEIHKRNLPAELALLPIIESAFDPYASSSAGAAGLWQMMPRTAEHYGIKQDWWYDGRRDIIMSTNAALDYLEKLYKDFKGDWLLTIAAYNAGGGTIRKAIRYNLSKNKKTDFWSLDLPKETKIYVPKLLAFIKIINNPQKYNQSLPELLHKPYFVVNNLNKQIDLNLVAKLSNMPLNEIYTLNPGYNRFATSPDGPYHLVLPYENSLIFNFNLANITEDQLVQYQQYKIQKGDTLIGISKKFNTTISVIKHLNHLANNTIRINHDLIIPIRSA